MGIYAENLHKYPKSGRFSLSNFILKSYLRILSGINDDIYHIYPNEENNVLQDSNFLGMQTNNNVYTQKADFYYVIDLSTVLCGVRDTYE